MIRHLYPFDRQRRATAVRRLSRAAAHALVVCGLVVTACGEEDRSQAEAGVDWLAERRLFRPVGKIGAVSKVTVESAELIRMEVIVNDKERVEAIEAQSLMVQSLIAKYACPKEGSDFWPILGDKVALRVDLLAGKDVIASGICRKP